MISPVTKGAKYNTQCEHCDLKRIGIQKAFWAIAMEIKDSVMTSWASSCNMRESNMLEGHDIHPICRSLLLII